MQLCRDSPMSSSTTSDALHRARSRDAADMLSVLCVELRAVRGGVAKNFLILLRFTFCVRAPGSDWCNFCERRTPIDSGEVCKKEAHSRDNNTIEVHRIKRCPP